jgi:hypothetical protein
MDDLCRSWVMTVAPSGCAGFRDTVKSAIGRALEMT